MKRRFAVVALLAVLACLPLMAGPARAVVGGRLATESYSHMAALYFEGDQICGASLVAPQKILTAAHCILDKSPSKFSFVLGRNDLRSSGGETIAVTSVEVHPSYDKPPASHDIAILTLATPSSYAPIAIADPATQRSLWAAGETARVIGYGGQAYPGLLADDRLREVDVPMVSDEECGSSYAFTGDFDADTMVCAGELLGLKDSCQGDSGGPLMAKAASGEWVQTGVVSWGVGCGFPTQYGVYSRVGDQPLYDWIHARI